MNIQELDKINTFFVLTRPRSGSTLVSLLFFAHYNVSIANDSHLVTRLYFKFKGVKKWNNKSLNQFVNFANSLKRIEIKDKIKFRSDILLLGENATLPRLIKTVYLNINNYIEKENIIIIGDKTPYFSLQKHYFDILEELFPNLKVIHLLRDYRDHYQSIQKVSIQIKQRAIIAYNWLYSCKIIKSKFGGTPNYYAIKYEDLVSYPEKYAIEICNFLDIMYLPEMLEFHKKKDLLEEKYNANLEDVKFKLFHSKLLKPISNKYIYTWKNSLDDKTVRVMDSIIGDYAELCGYERKFFTKPNLFLIWQLKFIIWLKSFIISKTDKLPYNVSFIFRGLLNKFVQIYSKTLHK